MRKVANYSFFRLAEGDFYAVEIYFKLKFISE